MPAVIALAFAALTFTGTAGAAPTQLTVRIEGEERTLFEGPILTDGRTIRAASDKVTRPCDGTNNGANPEPGPTPTAAAVDAMAIVGEGFDGQWYSGFDDYFIQRWGPDGQDFDGFSFWGVLVDGAFTPVGGCQARSEAGDEVLWTIDAFGSRPFLRLATATDPSLPPEPALPTASVEQGASLALSVNSYTGAGGGPESLEPAAGAVVAPVATDPAKGYQQVGASDPAAVTTGGDGTVSISFSVPGWHRLKAVKAGHVRSNRLDVCVEAVGGGGCGPLPLDAQVRVPPELPVPPDVPPPTSQPPAGEAPASPIVGGEPGPSSLQLGVVISFGRVKANRATGSALIAISVPGPGLLTLSGNGVRRQSTRAGAAGSVPLAVRARGRRLRRLRETGTATVTVTAVFTPVQGAAATARRRVVLRLGDPQG